MTEIFIHNAMTGTRFVDLCVQDERLIQRCQQGDRAAWETLIASHAERVYGICYRFTGRHCDAEDMAQEAFLRIFVRLGTFRANQLSFISWLTTLTQNLLIDRYRCTRMDRLTVSTDEGRFRDAVRSTRAGDPEHELLREEQRQLLQCELQKLAPEAREVIDLCHIQEIRCCEVAQRLGVPEGTVKSRLNRGRTNLKRLLRITGASRSQSESDKKDCAK